MSKFKGTVNAMRIIDVHDDTSTIDVKDRERRKIATFWRYNSGVEVMDREEQKANAVLFTKAPEILQALQRIFYASEERGVQGCTYGDTDMSSTDVAFGYNLALEHLKHGLEELMNQATGVAVKVSPGDGIDPLEEKGFSFEAGV